MENQTYFQRHKGIGILATADAQGKVNAAVYSRPHFLEDGTVAFIMRDRLTRHNLKSNPFAAYLFVEDGPGYQGKRLYLEKLREEKDSELIDKIRRRTNSKNNEVSRFLVVFELKSELPLIGAAEEVTKPENGVPA